MKPTAPLRANVSAIVIRPGPWLISFSLGHVSQAGYFALFPDYHIEIESAASQDAVVLACGFASATHAASQKTWRIPAAWRAIVTDGKIAEWQVYADKQASL